MVKKKLKHIVDLYLRTITKPKLLKYGVEDVYVKGIKYPGEKLGGVFVYTEPNILQWDVEKYNEVKKIIELDVWNSLEMASESPEDWSIYFNKLPLFKLDESLPFNETINNNVRIRTFLESVADSELKWHQDNEDRMVSPLHETDWMVQLDDSFPVKLEVGKEILIPEGVWHRVIKGTGDLKVTVKFI